MIARLDDSLSQWEQCVTKCLAERVPAKRFAQFAQQLLSQGVVSRQATGRLLSHVTGIRHDALKQSYISAALQSGLLREAELLQALLDLTVEGRKTINQSEKPHDRTSVQDQIAIIKATTVSCSSRARPKTRLEATDILSAVSQWMKRICPAFEEADGLTNSYLFHDDGFFSLQQAVSGLFCELVHNNVYVQSALQSDLGSGKEQVLHQSGLSNEHTDLGRTLSEALQALIGQFSVTLPQYADALRNIQQSYASLQRHEDKDKISESGNAAVMAMQLGANIVDGLRPGRASLTLYLDSVLHGLPSASSEEILHFLLGQYQGDIGSLIISLMSSAFALIAVSRPQQDDQDEQFLLQSFLISSVPSMLARASSMFTSSAEFGVLIAQTLEQLDLDGQNPFKDTYEPVVPNSQGTGCQPAFIRTCFKRGLLGHDHAQQLLANSGDTALPESPRLDKVRLAEALHSTQERQRQLIDELNASAASTKPRAEVLGKHLHQLLDAGNISSLKLLLERLAVRPHALDNLFLFSGANVVEGVCRLIDNWQWGKDKDQAHESYEALSACLTFVMVAKHRFGLDLDLPDENPQSITRSLLALGYPPPSFEDCSTERLNLVGDWLQALLENDQWGIPGELLSKHSPHLFYQSSPMLYNQLFQAYARGLLPTDKLTNALASLQTMITLPALTVGIRVLISVGWQQSISTMSITDLLKTMTTPSSSEEHIGELHRAVLSCSREHLLALLHDVQRRHPDNKDLKPRLDRITSLTPSRAPRRLTTEGLLNDQGGPASLLDRLGYAFNALCAWETTGAFPNPFFRHEDLLLTIQLYGCQRIITSLIDLMTFHRANAQPGEVDVALDLAAMFVVAHEVSKKKFASSQSPNGTHRAPRQTLRRALRYERSNADKLMNRDPQRAQNITLLHQLVERRLAPQPLQDDMAMQMQSAVEGVDLTSAAGDITSTDLAGQGIMQRLDQDATRMDFSNGADVFDPGLDFDDGGFFTPPVAGMQTQDSDQAETQGPVGGDEAMDFSVPPAQRQEGMQEQQFEALEGGALGEQRQQQQQQQDMDLFAGFDGPQDFFGQPGMEEQTLEQAQMQGNTTAQQEAQGTEAIGVDGRQGAQAQTEEDFWASMGF